MRYWLASLVLLLPAGTVSADDVLTGWSRFGSVYHRIDMDNGTPQACAALCDRDGQCQAWVFVPHGLEGPDSRCELLSTTATPHPYPGRTTGLSSTLVRWIEEAAMRTPTTLEIEALRATLSDASADQ